MALKPVEREMLETANLFQQFMKRRREIRVKSPTMSGVAAHQQALSEFMPLARNVVAEVDRDIKRGTSSLDPGSVPADDAGGTAPVDSSVVCKRQFKSQSAPAAVIVEWVFNNLSVIDAQTGDAPCPGAWSWLQHLRKNPAAIGSFYEKCFTRLIPSKAELGNQEQFRDNGKVMQDLCDELLRSVADDSEGEDE
jgi:hypothetical protein